MPLPGANASCGLETSPVTVRTVGQHAVTLSFFNEAIPCETRHARFA